MTLVPVDPKSELAVSDYLDKARTWLATAVEMTGPAEIAAARAQIATAAEAARQLNLSKGIRDDATEMVRRAEYAVSRAIQKGQDEGTVRVRGQRSGTRGSYTRTRFGAEESVQADRANSANNLPGPQDIAPDYSSNGGRIRQLAQADPDEFETALTEAKAEGNMSLANVARKVRKQPGPNTRATRAELIADLAAKGYSSRQMPAKVGVTEETVRQIARDFDIEIPADKAISGTRRINSARVVENTATALEGLVMGLDLIDATTVDPAVAGQWVDSLTDSMRALNRFVKHIRKATQ